MKIEEIRELAVIMREEGLSAVELGADGHLRIERMTARTPEIPAVQMVLPHGAEALPVSAPVKAEKPDPVDFNNMKEVKCPVVGVFYQAASPEAKPYVTIGSHVKKGDTLCIIEAMKVMNEIASEFDGEVVEICAEDGMIVEYGQTLFKIC